VPLAWAIVLVLVVAALGIGVTAGYYELRPATTPGSIHVTDDLGRSVTTPYQPSRVAVLAPSDLDVMVRLGLRSDVVAIGCAAPTPAGLAEDYSPDQVALWHLTPSMCVADLPLDEEQLVNVSADLVLAATIDDLNDLFTYSVTYHIAVMVLQPATLSGILVDDSLIGTIYGVTAAADALNDQLLRELANATAIQTILLDNGTPLPSVLLTYGVDSNGYYTFGPSSFGQSLVEFASAASISASSSYAYPELAGEQVLAANPHIIIYGTGYGYNESVYATGPFWSSFPAVQNGNISGIDSNLITEPDPTMILVGLPALLAILHPNLL
jgi:ABC-type Fe3+-hydroxamate transport system substrate-binding protein